jgi:1-acyl-sn-glycerol-3-phosphate acyltransferase
MADERGVEAASASEHMGHAHGDARREDADIVLPLPPSVPRVRANRFARWVGRTILRLGGWRMVGAFPDIPKLVLIGAPHSSNWDGVYGFAAKLALGLDIKILGKRELFWWPLGPLLRRLGVISVDRTAAHGVVEQVAAMIHATPRFWFGLAPEGTRKQVDSWKTGFWKIAKAADVPVLPAYFHYPDKVIGIGPTFALTDDMAADIARIRTWYRPWQGRYHGTP